MIAETELLSLLQRGEHKAMEDIYRYYWEEVLDAAYKRVRDEEIAQDICQEIFISLWENRENIQLKGSLSAYFMGAVKYRVINYFRSSQVKEKHQEDLRLLMMECAGLSAVQGMMLKELHQEVEEAIQELPERMRVIFSMSRQEEKTIREISEELDLSAQTVKNQLSSALKVMKKRLSYLLFMTICMLFI
ncbi:RNA polymerase sigma-70 factor [Pedobacter gandavensis]|uniref:RNA polymerase sigma factor n=1 Tax=Pedobacter TaxID=84567 RepID=UPI001C9928E8|nr:MULTISPECIES: RNA polymerase sigma-70 factor [Pedobacter]WGQ09551.1 RNA polymerase sigma-70 factor [Pedobacter gandavensis]